MADCSCERCRSACTTRAGWFMPEEAARVKESPLGAQLMYDYAVHSSGETISILTPAFLNGRCVFYRNGLCSIHAMKPFECREMMHDDSQEVAMRRRADIAAAWHLSP